MKRLPLHRPHSDGLVETLKGHLALVGELEVFAREKLLHELREG